MDKELITTFKKYKESYNNGLENHKAVYEDYDELHFINSELGFYQICYETANVTEQRLIVNNKDYTEYEYRYINEFEYNDINQIDSNIYENYDVKNLIKDDSKFLSDGYSLEICNKLTISFTKIISFLETKKSELETNSQTVMTTENTLKWHGDKTHFIELIKALIEDENIKGNQKDIINKLSNVFNIEIKHQDKLINDLKLRNNGSETLFLDKLKKSLFDYITREKKK